MNNVTSRTKFQVGSANVTSRTKFQVEMTYDGGTYRKIDPTGGWTTYPVEPMTLAQAEFVCADHNSRGTTSTFRIVDVEFEAAQIKFAGAAKQAFMEAVGYDKMSREDRMAATGLRAVAINVFNAASAHFLAIYLRQCYCV